jgi:predicted MFS family arabinose efflux permease
MGVSLTEILLMVYGLAIMLNATTSSFLLRYLPQKSVIALGETLKAIGLLLIVLGTQVANTNFWLPFLGQIIGGSGFSIAISTDSGLLRYITRSAPPDLFDKIQSESQSLMFLATLLAGATGSILFDYEAHWPFFTSILANILAIISVLLVKEKATPKASTKLSSASTVEVKITSTQNFWMNYYALSRAFLLAPFVGFLPFFFLMLQVDLPFFGLVLSLFSIGAFLSALYSVQLLKAIGSTNLMILTMGFMLISMLIFNFFQDFSISLIAITLLGLGSGCVRPIAMKNLNLKEVSPQQRAKLLSSMEQRFSLINAFLLLAGGYILVEQSFKALMLQMTIAYIIAIALAFSRNFLNSFRLSNT